MRITIVLSGTALTLYFTNSATGTLHVKDLVITGIAWTASDRQQITYTDWASAVEYGLKAPQVIDLPFIDSENYARSVAQSALHLDAQPRFIVRQIAYNAIDSTLDALFGVVMGDIMQVSDYGQVITDGLFLVRGAQLDFNGYRLASFVFDVMRADGMAYWVLGVSKLGVSTRLGA